MLTSAALRGLLDATPSAIACFDATLRTVYANTAFTTVTGVQGGRPLEEETLAEVREMLAGTGAPRRVRLGGRGRMPVSGTLFRLDEGLIGMVLDAGAHEALAVLAAEQSALRRVATLVAASPEPEAVFTAVAEEAGRLLHARSAATIRYEEGYAVTVGRWADDDLGGFEIGTGGAAGGQRGADRDRRPHRRAGPDRGLHRRARARRRADARARLPLGGGGADRGRRRDLGAAAGGVRGRAGDGRRAPAGGVRRARRARAGERRGARGADRVADPDPGGGRDRAPAARAQPARRCAAAAGRARRAAARAREAARRARGDALLRAAAEELNHALAELRELARGLHPAVLVDRGLAPALETLARARRCRCRSRACPAERLAEPLEAAVYFVVAESLTNAVKHADASELRVRMRAENGELHVEIADDGRGGADPRKGDGTGLRGLADRVEALGGRLALESPPGAGHRRPRRAAAIRTEL